MAGQLVTRLILFWGWFLNGSGFKGIAGSVCHIFETFRRGSILLELKLISFLPIVSKLIFNVAQFDHLLRMFSCFYPLFFKSGIKE